jgi:hypothetical protein
MEEVVDFLIDPYLFVSCGFRIGYLKDEYLYDLAAEIRALSQEVAKVIFVRLHDFQSSTSTLAPKGFFDGVGVLAIQLQGGRGSDIFKRVFEAALLIGGLFKEFNSKSVPIKVDWLDLPFVVAFASDAVLRSHLSAAEVKAPDPSELFFTPDFILAQRALMAPWVDVYAAALRSRTRPPEDDSWLRECMARNVALRPDQVCLFSARSCFVYAQHSGAERLSALLATHRWQVTFASVLTSSPTLLYLLDHLPGSGSQRLGAALCGLRNQPVRICGAGRPVRARSEWCAGWADRKHSARARWLDARYVDAVQSAALRGECVRERRAGPHPAPGRGV